MNIRERTLVLVKDGEVEVGYTEGPVIMDVVGITLQKPGRDPFEFLPVDFISQSDRGTQRGTQSFCKFRMVPLVSRVRKGCKKVEMALQIYRPRLIDLPRDIRIRVNECTRGLMGPLAPL